MEMCWLVFCAQHDDPPVNSIHHHLQQNPLLNTTQHACGTSSRRILFTNKEQRDCSTISSLGIERFQSVLVLYQLNVCTIRTYAALI